jgi:hypothetical protein
MVQGKKITAPFSADTVAKLNAWQQSGMFHPFQIRLKCPETQLPNE